MASDDFEKEPKRPVEGGTSKTKGKPSAGTGMNLLAQVSTLSWNLVIPIVGGVLLGHFIDKRNESGATWTLSLLVLGILISFSNLYNIYIEHSRQAKENDDKENADEEINDQKE